MPLDMLKSPGFVPLAPRLAIVKVALPVFVRVTDCAALVEFRGWLGKVSAPGERLTVGPTPVPVNAIASGLL